MQDVRKVFQDIAPKLNLSESPPIKNFQSLVAVKENLMDNRVRFCVLVVDADRIKYAHGRQPQGSSEYPQILETAANQVGKIRRILIRSVQFILLFILLYSLLFYTNKAK